MTYDTSDKMRMNLLSDVIDRLRKLGCLSDACPAISGLLAPESESYKALRDAQLFDTIDFIRAVHAEASALYSLRVILLEERRFTSRPFHVTGARHIVVSGIRRVVYIEPTPKAWFRSYSATRYRSMLMNKAISAFNLFRLLGLHHPCIRNCLNRLRTKKEKIRTERQKFWTASSSFPTSFCLILS